MIRKFNKVLEHKGGLTGITSNPDFPNKDGIFKTRVEEHQEIRKLAEEKVEREIREKKSEQNKADEVVSE